MKHPRGSASGDLILFIVFIVLLGIVWVFTGGPDRSISHSGPFLNSPLGENGLFSIPSVNTSGDGSSESFISQVNSGIANLQAGEEKSPYAENVSLSISTANSQTPSEEYLTIKTSRTLSGTLTISDWRLESTVSNTSVILGTAAQVPYSGQVNSQAPVAVGANTVVYVVSGRSPIGTSFRINSCTGYFAQYQNFEPRLPIECPFPSLELSAARQKYSNFFPSPECSTYVGSIGQCTFAGTAVPNNLEPNCRAIVLNDLSYNGCVAAHHNDADFYKNEWRFYLNRDQELWKQKDRIRLLDEAGKVIDVVSY